MHTYLNGDFYNGFSDVDKAMIASTSNTNPDNGSISGGEVTDDYIYLLSIEEVNALGSSIRNCDSWWWLRSPGYNYSNRAAIVDVDGSVVTIGRSVDVEYGVRPALNLEF